MTNVEAWDRLAARSVPAVEDAPAVVRYRVGGPTEAQLRLCGDVNGRRVLDLGCRAGANAVALARQGAKVIGVDASTGQLARARALAEANAVRIELHHGDVSDLAFLPAASIDLVVAIDALNEVDDLGRVFRGVHRALKSEASLVVSLRHPVADLVDGADRLRLGRGYWDRAPIEVRIGGEAMVLTHHTVSSVFTTLQRSGFRVDALLEPEPDPSATSPSMLPALLVLRGRKLGT